MSEENTSETKDPYYAFGSPIPEEKHNVHSFLNSVATSEDTTKTGNLEIGELGLPRTNLRTIKEMSLIASDIMDNSFMSDYYKKKGEILTATSLSKDGKLINLAVIQKRQIEDQTQKPKENKGWFGSKDKKDELNSGKVN